MFPGVTARPSPDWLRNGTVYEIFPRDFSVDGNLGGVTAKLDELQSLGVNILWTMPIHPIGQKFRKGDYGSPYSIKDYYAVDANYGTVSDYQQLVSEAHKRGMKVIMDLVADHTAWDSVMMQHPEFYKHDAQGKIMSTGAGMDGCGRSKLWQSGTAPIHGRDAEILDSNMRRGRVSLRCCRHDPDGFLGTSPQ